MLTISRYAVLALDAASGYLSAPNDESAALLRVMAFPNPVIGSEVYLQIEGATSQQVRLQPMDSKGRILSDRQVELSSLPAGLLLLRASTAKQSQTLKVVKP